MRSGTSNRQLRSTETTRKRHDRCDAASLQTRALYTLCLLLGLLHSALAGAEVTEVNDFGFTSTHTAELPMAPAAAWQLLTEGLPGWWDARHSYGLKAENLSLDPGPPGCLCERLDNGGWVEHLRVTYFEPEKVLRLDGALGPLAAMGLQGVMRWTLEPLETGGTRFTSTYRVRGHLPGGFEQLAPAVDGVNGGHFTRLESVARGEAP